MHTLYLYSTESIKRATVRVDGSMSWPPRGKVGETMLNNAIVRVDQQDGTSAFEALTLLASKNVPRHLTDHDIRRKLISYGYMECRIDKKREWIRFVGLNNEIDMIRVWNEAINDCLYGVRAFVDFPPYNFQQELVDSAASGILAGFTDRLLSAIMRTGKCLISYEIVRKLKFKKVLVITGKPGVNDGWNELLPGGTKTHINYANWKYHDYCQPKIKKNGLSLGPDTNVVFVSLQYINKHLSKYPDKPLPKLMEELLHIYWDIVLFDEQHFSTQTINTAQIFKKLSYHSKIELSGTAYKTLIQGRYGPESIDAFDYIDEQTRRLHGTTTEQSALKYRADINYALIGVPTNVRVLLGNDGFSFTKLFAVSDGYLKNAQAVTDFLNFVKTKAYGNQYVGVMAKFRPYVSYLNRHTLWVVPDGIASADAFTTLLDQHPYFKGFKIIKGYGNNIKRLSVVLDTMQQVDNGQHLGKDKGTITVTMGRFLEGTTVPKWWAVHQMNDDKSATSYFQGCFRNKSENADDDKQHVIVYDYNPDRYIEVVYTSNLDSVRRQIGQTTSGRLREYLEVSPVYDYVDNEFTLMTGEELAERANRNIKLKMNLFNSVNIDQSKITNTLQELMIDKSKQTGCGAITTISSNGLPKTPNRVTGSGSPKKEAEKKSPADILTETTEKFKQAMCRITNAVYATYGSSIPIGTFDDICNYADIEFISNHTGLSPREWTMWRDSGAIIDVCQINRRIDAFSETVNI